MTFLKQLIEEVNKKTTWGQSEQGLVANALREAKAKEYREFMLVIKGVPNKTQKQLFIVLWPLLQKSFDLGYLLGKRDKR